MRDHRTENFPVASLLLARAVRPRVLAFYRFVRTADDIADDPGSTSEHKLARLDALEAALDDPATTEPAAQPIHATGAGAEEARRMLSAFRQDATQTRYADWATLEDYCARSAVPVGRMLLRLHDETDERTRAAADALCTALQILNHMQDLVPDRETLNRVYLPESWMALADGEAAFFDRDRSAARRPVLDAALDRVEDALNRAAALPRLLHARRLALEAAVTLHLAQRLLWRLRGSDPVMHRVALTRPDFARAFAAAPRLGRSDAAIVCAQITRAGSSFARGMRALGGERRRSLWAVYAFCRAVDDVADATMPIAEKHRALDAWEARLEAPDCALSRALHAAREAHDLPIGECRAMIAGMRADSAARLRIADGAALDLYCRRVAGSVGAMAVRIFGAPDAESFALSLGRTLQLVNILRDLDEDASRDRVYLPSDLLAAHGVADAPAAEMLASPGFAEAARCLAVEALAGFTRAESDLRHLDTSALLPARIMMWGYRRLLDRLLARGFAPPRPRPRLTRTEKLHMALVAAGLARLRAA